MRFRNLWLLPAALVLILSPQAGQAQLTVQQPVFGVTSVATTVSVPDRGRAHLGSISRARDSRTSFGPFRPGTNIGLDREHSGMSVGVYIHDFEAMDRYLLNQGNSGSDPSRLSGNARHAWDQLSASHRGAKAVSKPSPKPLDKAQKYWQLGQKAEREGKRSVARLHYRIASRYGSEAAETRLAQWEAANRMSASAE